MPFAPVIRHWFVCLESSQTEPKSQVTVTIAGWYILYQQQGRYHLLFGGPSRERAQEVARFLFAQK